MLRLFAVACFFSVILNVSAQPTPAPIPAAAAVSADNPQAFDPAAATRAWLNTMPPDKRAKSDAYFEGGYWILLWDFLVAVAIAIFLLQSGWSARLRDFAQSATQFRPLQIVLYALLFTLIVAVLSFPLAIYEQFYREHQYGLATQTFGSWFADQLKGLVLALIAVPVTLTVLYAVFRRTPHTWWIWGTVATVALSLFANFIAPVFVFPLFNDYKPLQDPAVRDPILAMARANQIPVSQVFVFDASRQTTRVSANVAGLFGTTRIALNDNLLKQCSLPEIRQVMAHEMGHYILNHGGKLSLYSGILFLVAFALSKQLFDWSVARWGARWRIAGISDPAGVPLLWLILTVIFFFATPITNTMTRITEREADAFGINTSREPDGFAMASLKLGAYRKLDPGPIEEAIFFDHPSGRARIRMAMDWKAAQLPCGGKAVSAEPAR